MINKDVFLVFSEEVSERLVMLESTESTEEMIRYIETIERSSKLVGLESLSRNAKRLANLIESNTDLDKREISGFVREANSIIQRTTERLNTTTLGVKPVKPWWKFW